MAVTPRNHPHALPVIATAIAIVLVTFVANRLAATSGEARPRLAASQTTLGAASEKSAAKERIRYQATIDNWRRYRESTKSD